MRPKASWADLICRTYQHYHRQYHHRSMNSFSFSEYIHRLHYVTYVGHAKKRKHAGISVNWYEIDTTMYEMANGERYDSVRTDTHHANCMMCIGSNWIIAFSVRHFIHCRINFISIHWYSRMFSYDAITVTRFEQRRKTKDIDDNGERWVCDWIREQREQPAVVEGQSANVSLCCRTR